MNEHDRPSTPTDHVETDAKSSSPQGGKGRPGDLNATNPTSDSETAQEQGPEYFDQKHKGNLLDPDTARIDHASPQPTSSNPKSTQAMSRVQRAETAPVGVMRPSIDRGSQTEEVLSPQKSLTIPHNTRIRRSNSSPRRHGLRRAPFSYRFNDISDTESSSSSDDDGEGIAPLTRSPSRLAGLSIQDRPKSKQVQRAQSYNRIALGNDQYQTKGKVSKRDGRLRISINENVNSGRVAKWLGKSIRNHLDVTHKSSLRHAKDAPSEFADAEAKRVADDLRKIPKPRLNIVIMVIGSRGDIQPFLKIGQVLRDRGHRVRIATHPAFREFVQKDIGLEFFSVGGDPSELMAFMVKNPGLIPSFETVRHGEIARRRTAMAEMFEGFWRSCINATDDEKDEANHRMMEEQQPFVADAIIANPPSFAHVHIAERLGVPLHMMFTFPYSPTVQFPHPLANIKTTKGNVDAGYVNFMSYALVEMMTWQGLGDLVNSFRVRTLGLEPVSSFWAPDALWRMHVPYSYMWSPELIPKPKDWGEEINVTGFVFLDLASNFDPPAALTTFLDAGPPPIYIGFGSIVVDDPEHFTQLIFEAVELAGVRALVSTGWGGIGGGDGAPVPSSVFMLDNTPHDWLFPRCAAVVHHGGAGTSAIGLKCGRPTVIVPFFGDQPFWGAMVADNKAGAHASIPYKKLTAQRLADGIQQCLTDEARANASRIAEGIEREGDGAENAVRSFEESLPLGGHHNMRCSILEDRVAVWKLKHSNSRLSALAATLLVDQRKVSWTQLNLLRHYDYNDFDGPGEPISGMGGAALRTAHGVGKGLGMIPYRMEGHIKDRNQHEKRKKKRRERRESRTRHQTRDDGAVEEEHRQVDTTTLNVAKRPSAPPHARTGSTLVSQLSADPEQPLALELAEDAGTGVRRAFASLFWAPLDMHLAVAQGFHNAPRLYGDSTVRKPMRINGIKSGMKAARNEFCLGIYDGVTGLVTQPVNGVKFAEGPAAKFGGFWTGVGKGVGGAVLKPTSAFISAPAFFGQGFRKEVKRRSKGPVARGNDRIRQAHISRGRKDVGEVESGENGEKDLRELQRRVDHGWRTMTEVWAAAAQYKKAGGRVIGPWRSRQERKRWERTGALDNVSATERALKSAKNREDLEEFFEQREREMTLADQPQESADVKARDPDLDDNKEVLQQQGEDRTRRDGNVMGDEADGGNETDSTKVASSNASRMHGDDGKVDVKDKDIPRTGASVRSAVRPSAGRPVAS